MSALRLSCSARADRVVGVWRDLLFGPVVVLVVLCSSLLIPVRAQAQVNMTLGQLMPSLIRNTSQVVTASSAGLQVAEAGSVAIGSGASTIGTVAINELRVIPLARVAARIATASAPVILTMLAADLISYGITQCQNSATGWCSNGSSQSGGGSPAYVALANASSGYVYGYFSGAASACDAGGAYVDPNAHPLPLSYNASSGLCVDAAGISAQLQVRLYSTGSPPVACTSPNTLQLNGSGRYGCAAPQSSSAMTYPALSDALAKVLGSNPTRAKDYWGFEPWTEQSSWLADPSTQALPAQVVSPSNGTVTGPMQSTQTSAGTSTTNTSCTVSSNSDAASLASKPVVVTCTQTTTNPDGTTSTTTTTTKPTTGDGTNPQVPASSPIPCGLGTNGSPKCQIDETGTPSTTAATTAMVQPATDLQTAEQTAVAQLNNVNTGLSWSLHMPHILPGGTCQPIEWFSWGSWSGSWDVCTQLQYVHDLLAWLWPVLSAVYVWNKAAGANAGVV